jgi:hypothetical protein
MPIVRPPYPVPAGPPALYAQFYAHTHFCKNTKKLLCCQRVFMDFRYFYFRRAYRHRALLYIKAQTVAEDAHRYSVLLLRFYIKDEM